VIWGITAGVTTLSNAATTAGVVENASIQLGGATETVVDADGDHVSRIDHGAENKITLEIKCLATSTLPDKGTELTGLSAIDGVALNSGRTFVDDAQVTYASTAVKKITVSATHYPTMPADPT
jgi:hypothetical protein